MIAGGCAKSSYLYILLVTSLCQTHDYNLELGYVIGYTIIVTNNCLIFLKDANTRQDSIVESQLKCYKL